MRLAASMILRIGRARGAESARASPTAPAKARAITASTDRETSRACASVFARGTATRETPMTLPALITGTAT